MERLVELFNANPHSEFEIRLKGVSDVIDKLLAYAKTNKLPIEYEQSVRSITSEPGNRSKMTVITFKNGIREATSYMLKTRIESLDTRIHNLGLRVAVAEEREIPAYRALVCDLHRVRWRVSLNLGDWRIDATIVENVTSADKLKPVVRSMFPPDKPAADSRPDAGVSGRQVELEIERITRPMKSGDVSSAIEQALRIISPEFAVKAEIQMLLNQVAPLINQRPGSTLKQLLNKAKELTKNSLHELDPVSEWYITDKADGERCLLVMLKDSAEVKIISSDIDTKKAKSGFDATIADSEMIEGTPRIFDVLMYDGELLTKLPLSERLPYFDKASVVLGFPVKRFDRLDGKIADKIEKFKTYVKKLPYETDGYILTPDRDYFAQPLKVKYPEKLSIDFLVMRAPQVSETAKQRSRKAGVLYYLFSGISDQMFNKFQMSRVAGYYESIFKDWSLNPAYFPIQFSPSSFPRAYICENDNPNLHRKICEMRWTGPETGWKLLRIREDREAEVDSGKYFGNNFSIAESIWQSYRNPVDIDDIVNLAAGETKVADDADDEEAGGKKNYFKQHANPRYEKVRHFNSYVKSRLMEFRNPGIVIDLASGKGQDLNRYAKLRPGKILFVEYDETAIQELIARKHSMTTPMNMFVMQADLRSDADKLTDQIREFVEPANVIVCNFAIHYFVSDLHAIENFIRIISNNLVAGGTFLYTAFNGAKVAALLGDKEEWTVYDDTVKLYSIKKLYKGDSGVAIGNRIDVLLPFSAGEYYTEYLVDFDAVNAAFVDAGFEILSVTPFANFVPGRDLTPDDAKFVSLYYATQLRKKQI